MSEDRAKITFWTDRATAEEIRDVVYWISGLTVSSFCQEAVEAALENYKQMEVDLVDRKRSIRKDAGQPFPPRTGEVTQGRPPGT